MTYLIVATIAYFLGNVTGSYLISKLAFSEDIRTKGSGNAGTTNMLRTYGFLPALITLAIDALKGYLAVYIAASFNLDYATYLAGFMVVVGHCWPILLDFKGGKGMATSAGVMFFHSPKLLLGALILLILVNLIARMMSLTSLAIVLYSVAYVLLFMHDDKAMIIMTILMAIIIFYCHRDNIRRIIEGKENKISIKKG
ncbi:MAG: glycerol-3-phosphate 1-O-acyltransferase PlsY [Tissierellia bacterium]|nr:glycerol-3-phosphate 1-O-acyltransferase PlsY [Tissierellia bacterium]